MILVGVLLIVLALLGAPLFAVIAASTIWGHYRTELPMSGIPIDFFGLAETPILLAIPLFTYAGYVLSESEAPARLVRLTRAWMGWMPGGLAVVALATCAFFTAFTGASGVTIIALGALLYPALAQDGYPENFNLGLVTSAGSLGLLFAPSLPLILYGIVAKTSIDDLFLAGVFPGLLMVVMLAGYSIWINRENRRQLADFSFADGLATLRESAWELPLPIVVLGGIYSGYFAVSEAAAVTALYVTIVEVFIRREISLQRLAGVMRESMVLVGGILIILGVSLASTNYMILQDVPQQTFELIDGLVDTQAGFLALLIVFLLVLGAFLDIFSALILVVPLILPIATSFGVHPLHLGIVFLATMQLGYLTPPVGLNLFIASYRFDAPIMTIYRATLPFLLILLVSVIIIAYVPQMTLALID